MKRFIGLGLILLLMFCSLAGAADGRVIIKDKDGKGITTMVIPQGSYVIIEIAGETFHLWDSGKIERMRWDTLTPMNGPINWWSYRDNTTIPLPGSMTPN